MFASLSDLLFRSYAGGLQAETPLTSLSRFAEPPLRTMIDRMPRLVFGYVPHALAFCSRAEPSRAEPSRIAALRAKPHCGTRCGRSNTPATMSAASSQGCWTPLLMAQAIEVAHDPSQSIVSINRTSGNIPRQSSKTSADSGGPLQMYLSSSLLQPPLDKILIFISLIR